MKNRSGEKIKLASIDELLGVVNEESAMEIEISKIHPFKNHPFKVLDDEKMQDLVESVRIMQYPIHSCCPCNSCRQTGMIPETGYIALTLTAVNLLKKHLPFY